MRWLLLVSLFTALYADLPSCARARCLHCEVEFISRMCPDVCSRCPGRVQSPVPQNTIPRQPAPIYRQPQPQQPVPTPPQRREAPQPPPAQIVPPPRPQQQQQQQQQQHFVQLQQTHYLPTQNQPQAQQFAAPNTQPQQPQYQQYQPQIVVTQPPPPPAVTPSREQAVTLAPLIQMPSAEEINQQLVAQQRILSNGLYSQVPRAAQAPEPQQQATQQSTQQNTLFPGLFPNQQPSQTSSQTSPFFNPFQPFLQNLGLAPSAPSASNPFGLPTFPPNQFFSTTAPTPQQQYNQASYYGVNGQQQQQRSPYGVQQQQQQQYQGYQQASQSKALATNSIQQSTNYAQQGNQVVARSIDSSPQTYEKNFYAGVAKPQVQYPQCPRQPGWLPCIGKPEANQRFANCCARLGEGCMPLCNYDANLATMQLNVLTGRCPLQKVHDIMICASGYKDVTQCCEAYNVFEPGFEHCRPYCNPAGGLPEGGLLSEKYKCLGKLSYIQQCFYVSQNP
ncbi:unnamed protein product, partial [Mesorhabditis belari]|uniref:Domain of unknown function DB domain-containing protein n=1 Tax=Mesorhabditis belari TaxID=2138241 RepID=A0AAF3EUC9_9BILA